MTNLLGVLAPIIFVISPSIEALGFEKDLRPLVNENLLEFMNSTFERSPQLEGFDNESVIGPSRGYQGVLLISEGDETFTRVANNGALNIRLNVEPDTRFAIASLTKQFIGVALYRLSSQGKVNLHSALSRYFPNLSGEWGHVTPWRLLNHTARVNDHGYSLIKASTPWSNCRSSRSFEYSFENLLSKAFENPVNAFSVGELTLYSNAAYTVLAALIKRVSKVDYKEYIRREFLIPLKMENTGFIESEFSRVQIARGYGFVGENEDSISPPIDFSVFQGSADMYSNTDDLNKWAMAIRS
ncbi:MAG: beta-lactamase family protein, partial [Bdellovibrionales bacterium]|nr:beta-lactamase family protein [Bdellovibrionales bacterium]